METKPVCVCGCTKEQHEFEHEESHYPESRTVDYWQACEAHNCGRFRASLPWPDDDGWWWCSRPYIGDALVFAHVFANGIVVSSYGEVNDEHRWEKHHGPARFTKLLETNPYTKEPSDG